MTGRLDPERQPWAARLLRHRLAQPDQRSCGATCLVLARVLADEAYAELLASTPSRFRDEVLAMHRRVTGPADVRGRAQLPWPRALGTPPWAVARQLGPAYRTRAVLPHRREPAYDALIAALTRGPVALYAGNRRLPRHVVLVVGGDPARLEVFDPATGRLRDVRRAAFTGGRLQLSGWHVPWLVVRAA